MKCRQHGFTLIEIIIALVVIAIALGAILNTVGHSVSQASHIRNKTLAHWVAQNAATEKLLSASWPTPQNYTGVSEMAGKPWYWEIQVTQTPDVNIRLMQVNVFMDKRQTDKLAGIKRYISQPFMMKK